MADLPEGIDLPRHRDFEGRGSGQWARHVFLLLLVALVVAALLNVFGSASTTSQAHSPIASLKVVAPERLRGGLLYQARFEVHARRPIGAPTLVLDRGWVEQTTINTLEPEPAETTTDAGHLKIRYPPMTPGRVLVVFVDLQVNPNDVGSHDQDVALYDADRPIASVDRTQFNFP
jgi:hypothetical protein